MRAVFLFDCVGCLTNQLEIINEYENQWCNLNDATSDQKYTILEISRFSHFDLFEDYHITVKQFPFKDQLLLCVEWSCIHFFYQLLD